MNYIFTDNIIIYFFGIFTVMILMGAFAKLLSKNFYTLHVFVKKFNILDLEFPDTPLELATNIKGIFLLPAELSQRSLRSLKTFLYLDFIFICFLYGSFFLLCILISAKFTFWGYYIFIILAWLQIIPFICDVIKNIYLLNRIKPKAEVASEVAHKFYRAVEKIKWVIWLLAVVFCVSTLFYFWVSGKYSVASIRFAAVIAGEIILFFILRKIFSKGSQEALVTYQKVGN